MTYEQWLKVVDTHILQLCGMHRDDLDDWSYNDDFRNGVTPLACAKRAIRNAKRNCGM